MYLRPKIVILKIREIRLKMPYNNHYMYLTTNGLPTQNSLLLNNLMKFYSENNNMEKILPIINDNSLSLRLIDWFATNYSKKYYTVYNIKKKTEKKGDLKFILIIN